MYCSNCGKELNDEAAICLGCGKMVNRKPFEMQKESTPLKERPSKKHHHIHIILYSLFSLLTILLTFLLIIAILSNITLRKDLKNVLSLIQEAPETITSNQDTVSEENIASDPEGVEYDYFFETVSELIRAVENNPKEYDNKRIKVLGTAYKSADVAAILDPSLIPSDSTGVRALYMYYANVHLDVDTPRYSFWDTGDYIKLYGTITITDEAVILSDYKYELLVAYKDRNKDPLS